MPLFFLITVQGVAMNILHYGGLPIKVWAKHIEDGALQQAANLSKLPFAFSHIAIMPDVHEGYGMPIGGVLALKNYIIPNAVGVDIGCGVIAVQTDVSSIEEDKIRKVFGIARELIPVGFKHHKKPQHWDGFSDAPQVEVMEKELQSAQHQIGTLGGGNHFLSIEKGSNGYIWLLVHSGSRNIGLKVAQFYNTVARMVDKAVPKEFDLASLPIDSAEGREYISTMAFCLTFAEANRDMLLDRFYHAFKLVSGSREIVQAIKVHHNYAAIEKHFGEELVVHRKGANSAKKGEPGVIPGSMGTPTFIVEGFGNPESFMSCSHGAGRVMSRKQANKTITEQAANNAMKGIVFGRWYGDYSEAPMAYKDIEEVMENQKDLVRPLVKLTPLGVMKG